MLRVYSYTIVHDLGFAPNPFWGYCTLACCKPVIRRTARVGDWVVATSSRRLENKLVYAMKITESPVTFGEYFVDPRFETKKPDYRRLGFIYKCGDNIYSPTADGGYRQIRSQHSLASGEENQAEKARDLSGKSVLISDQFSYFGSNAIELPKQLSFLIHARGHKCNFAELQVEATVQFLNSLKRGILGTPSDWPTGDRSFERACSGS